MDKGRQVKKVKPSSFDEKLTGGVINGLFQGISNVCSNTQSPEEKERIAWTKILTIKKPVEEVHEPTEPFLFLALGYTNGVHIWKLLPNGDADEVYSVRDGAISHIHIINSPSCTQDLYASERPLVAFVTTSVKTSNYKENIFSTVAIKSIRTTKSIKLLKFEKTVADVTETDEYLIVSLKGSIIFVDIYTFNIRFKLEGCYPSPGLSPNPIAIGTRWLAYSPDKLMIELKSLGGLGNPDDHSYTDTMVGAAQNLKTAANIGIQFFTEGLNLFRNPNSPGTSPSGDQKWVPRSETDDRSSDLTAGLVTVLDIKSLGEKNLKQGDEKRVVTLHPSPGNVVAHFVAFRGFAITCMTFSPCGRILATSDTRGHSFNLYSIFVHPQDPTRTSVHHLYSLWRGETFSKVQELRFNWDCRWFCASTLRGTCHIYPITSFGGPPNVRTHTSNQVKSNCSIYRKSAGLDEFDKLEILQSNLPYTTTSQNESTDGEVLNMLQQRSCVNRSTHYNPRLKPFLQPCKLSAIAHIRPANKSIISQNLPIMLTGQSSFSSDQPTSSTNKPATNEGDITISTCFLQFPYKDTVSSYKSDSTKSGTQKLFVLSSTGYLAQYSLQPSPHSSVLPNFREDSMIEVKVISKRCWNLNRFSSWSCQPQITSDFNLVTRKDEEKTSEKSESLEVKTKQPKSNNCGDDKVTEVDVYVHPEWQSQIEQDTYDGPARRLWMGPQFVFAPLGSLAATKSITSHSSSLLTLADPGDNCVSTKLPPDGASPALKINRSKPIHISKTRGSVENLKGSLKSSQEVQVSYNGNPCDTESLELNLVKTLAEATQDLSTDKKQNEISLFDRWNNDLEELVVAPSNEDQNTSSNSLTL